MPNAMRSEDKSNGKAFVFHGVLWTRRNLRPVICLVMTVSYYMNDWPYNDGVSRIAEWVSKKD
jgi:hypothetical protein